MIIKHGESDLIYNFDAFNILLNIISSASQFELVIKAIQMLHNLFI